MTFPFVSLPDSGATHGAVSRRQVDFMSLVRLAKPNGLGGNRRKLALFQA
jgi:hypothetical protein